MILRYDVLNRLAERIGARRYLEIGVLDGTTFDAVSVAEKVSVDPGPVARVTHRMTSDAYFEALQPAERFDLVFVDTTGRSPKDQEGIYQLERSFQLSQVGKPVWKALALPASLQDPDLTNMINQFSPLQCQSLIMTKLDESVSFGSLFNATYVSQLPLSYFTTGQMVPEDFEVASKERVLDCLLNFSGNFSVPDSVQSQSKDDYFALNLPQAKGERQ